MANIEIHGGHLIDGVGSLQIKISEKFLKLDLGKEVVITEFRSFPHYCDEFRSPGPFLRIWGETRKEINAVVAVLRVMGITKQFDIETVLVNSFIPKEMGAKSPVVINILKKYNVGKKPQGGD